MKSVKKIFVKGQTVSGSYKFEDSKVFTIKKVNSFTLIETDKPAYKPKERGFIILLVEHLASKINLPCKAINYFF